VVLISRAWDRQIALAAALSQRIESEPHTRLRYFCSPYHQDSALYTFIVQLKRAAGFARDETTEKEFGKLRDLLALGAGSEDQLELLADLLHCRTPPPS
jgi:predicted ATPase